MVSPDIPDNLIHQRFVCWIYNANRYYPIEIFTTNYDYLFEISFERETIPYFDGFIGSYEPFFLPSAVEENDKLPREWIRLWKVHGSLGWTWDNTKGRIVREKGKNRLLVYPSLLKYDDSRKQPYQSFIDRLSSFIRKGESFLLISGYSFGDQHLNETILHALTCNRLSSVYALYYGDLDEDSSLTKIALNIPRLAVLANNSAVIGGKYGPWRLSREPSINESYEIGYYFDENAVATPDEEWEGKGKLKIADFVKLVEFMVKLIGYPEGEA